MIIKLNIKFQRVMYAKSTIINLFLRFHINVLMYGISKFVVQGRKEAENSF
jgi:hypothetical protein